MYWASDTQPHQMGNEVPNCLLSRNLTVEVMSGMSKPRSRRRAKRSSRTAVIMALEGIPSNQEKPPSPLRQARIFSRRSAVGRDSSLEPGSREAIWRTYQASLRDNTSLPWGSTCEGMASFTISSTVISFRTACEAGTFTKRERSSESSASRDMASLSTAEWASVSCWAAGYTGTRTCTASEKSEATKEACRRRADSSLRSE